MSTENTIHDEIEALILGTPDRLPEHDDVSPQQVVADPTVTDLERIWSHDHEDWGLLGPEAQEDEPLAVMRCVLRCGSRRRVYYQIERMDEDGVRYVAIDRQFTADEIGAEVFRDHGIHPQATPEEEAIA